MTNTSLNTLVYAKLRIRIYEVSKSFKFNFTYDNNVPRSSIKMQDVSTFIGYYYQSVKVFR